MSHIFSLGRVPGSIFSKYDGMVLGCENGLPALNFKIKKKNCCLSMLEKKQGLPWWLSGSVCQGGDMGSIPDPGRYHTLQSN